MSSQYHLIFKAKDIPGPVCHQMYDGDEPFEVRDLTTRVTIRVRAQDLSPYRHTLCMDGKEFQILNVVRY
jgi:hypothetical protein